MLDAGWADTDPNTHADPGAYSYSDSNSDRNADTSSYRDASTHCDPVAGTEPYADGNTDAHTHSDTDAGSEHLHAVADGNGGRPGKSPGIFRDHCRAEFRYS